MRRARLGAQAPSPAEAVTPRAIQKGGQPWGEFSDFAQSAIRQLLRWEASEASAPADLPSHGHTLSMSRAQWRR